MFYLDDDEGPDPDYGVFGDAGMEHPAPRPFDAKEAARADAHRKKRDREREVSAGFNSHMIYLYNQARRK